MSRFKKIFAVVTVVTMLGVAVIPAPASALTAAELQVQIDALMAQLATLQAQLTEVDGGSSSGTVSVSGIPSGFTWDTSLSVGSKGQDVMYLQMFLNSDSATKLADSGAGSPGNETTFFGPITRSGVIKFQDKYAADVLTPLGLSAGTGFFGSSSRAKINVLFASAPAPTDTTDTTTTTTDVVIVEGDLSVATPGPATTTLVASQATASMIDLTLVGSATVTGITLQRIGVSANGTASNVYLFDGSTRLTDAGTVNSDGMVTFNNANGLFIVNGIKTISVKSDILTGTSGETIGMQVTAITLASGSVTGLPVIGNLHTIATATLAGVTLGAITPTTSSIDAANDVIVWESTATVSTRKVTLDRLALRNIGSINSSDVSNFRLLVSGVEVAQTQSLDSNGYVTFDIAATPTVMATGNRILRVMADVTGGASRNLQLSLRRAADIGLVDSNFDVNITASDTYPASTGVISINSGTLTVVKASDSPSGNITDASVDAILARYTFTAFGESVKVETLNATVDSSDNSVTQLRNGRIMVNGTQVGSTAALVEKNTTATGTQYTTNFIVVPGTPVTVEIRADIFDDDGTNDVNANDTFTAELPVGSSNGVPQISLGTINVPTAAQVGNQVTVAIGSATLVETASYPDQTFTIPTTAYKIAEWDLTNGSTEATNITTIDADFAVANQLLIGNLSDVYVKYGSNTSTVKSSVVAATNVWSVNFQLNKNETMKVQVFANVSTFTVAGANDTVTVSMEISGTGVDSATAVTTGVIGGQTMTAGTGTILAAIDASSPNSALLDDSGTARVASFEFTTTNDVFTITEINVNIATATTVISAILMDGSTPLQTKPGATDVTFSGLSIPVVANGTKTLSIDLIMSTVGFGFGTSASNVAVTLDIVTSQDSQGVEYIDLSPESAQTDLTAGTDPVSNTAYAYKAVPTISLVSLPTGVLTTGTKTLAKFTISTNGTGTIAWRMLDFTVTKSMGGTDVVSAPTLWDGSTQIVGTAVVTGLGSGASGSIRFLATSEEQISGAKTYELRATVAGAPVAGDSINTSIANPLTTFAASAKAFASNTASGYRYFDAADGGTSNAADIRQSVAIQMTAPDVSAATNVTGHDASTTTEQTYGITGDVTLTLIEGSTDNQLDVATFVVTGDGSSGLTCTPFTGTDGTGAVTADSTEFVAVQSVTCTGTNMQLLIRDITVANDTGSNASNPGLVIVYTKGTDFATNSTVSANDSDDTLTLVAGVAATASFLWSDKSAQSHAITTTDWTRDYLVDVLPTSTQDLTK